MDLEQPTGVQGLGAYRRAERELYDRDQDRDDVLKRIEEKYKGGEYDEEEQEMPDEFDTSVVGQQGLLPTPHDPKLWMVTCRPGAEREASVQLMQKYTTMYNAGTPLRIMSVIVLDHVKVRLHSIPNELRMHSAINTNTRMRLG